MLQIGRRPASQRLWFVLSRHTINDCLYREPSSFSGLAYVLLTTRNGLMMMLPFPASCFCPHGVTWSTFGIVKRTDAANEWARVV